MSISTKERILHILKAHPFRAFRSYEIMRLVNDRATENISSHMISRSLAEMVSEKQIKATGMDRFQFFDKELKQGLHFAPHILEILKKSGKSFSKEIDDAIWNK